MIDFNIVEFEPKYMDQTIRLIGRVLRDVGAIS